MKYRVERAIVTNVEMFNLNDWIVINDEIITQLKDILWVDEYSAKIVTLHGEFLLDDIEIEKFKLLKKW